MENKLTNKEILASKKAYLITIEGEVKELNETLTAEEIREINGVNFDEDTAIFDLCDTGRVLLESVAEGEYCLVNARATELVNELIGKDPMNTDSVIFEDCIIISDGNFNIPEGGDFVRLKFNSVRG